MSLLNDLQARLAEITTATAAARAEAQQVALSLAAAPADAVASLEAKMADIEAELQSYALNQQRILLAIEAAKAAAQAQDSAALQSRLDASLARAQGDALQIHAQALDAALATALAAAQAFTTEATARRHALVDGAQALGQLVPQAARSAVEAAAAAGPLAGGAGIRDRVLTRMAELLRALDIRHDLGPVFNQTDKPMADIVAAEGEALAQLLAGWAPATVRRAHGLED